MQTTWVVAADSSRARIFEAQGTKEFNELQDFANPAGLESDQDLLTDAKGRFWGKGEREREPGHTGEPAVDAERHETDLYSKKVSEFLEQGRVAHRYDQLYLIAFPKFLGMLRDHLSKDAQKLIRQEIPKDISWFDAKDVHDFYLQHRLT